MLVLGAHALAAETTRLEWLPPTKCTDGRPLVLSHFTVYRDREPLTMFPADATSAELGLRAEACFEITATGRCGDDEPSESWYSNRGCTYFPAAPSSASVQITQ
jgi:hypothetical protein